LKKRLPVSVSADNANTADAAVGVFTAAAKGADALAAAYHCIRFVI